MMIPFDAHAHIGSPAERALRRQLGLCTMLSCTTPAQAEEAFALAAASPVFSVTAGVHPWHAADVTPEEMLPFMEHAALIGEIGLDSVWCSVPLNVQRRVFDRQLDWAAAAGKGIVLHTKGCEDEIARRIEGFAHPVVVHWYSGGADALERFAGQGCYLSIGPDAADNPAVQSVIRAVANDRILFETDGMDAVRWALGDMPDSQLPHALAASAAFAAKLRGQRIQDLIQTANGNFCRLLSR